MTQTNETIRAQMVKIMMGMKLGETQEVCIPADKFKSVRTAAYELRRTEQINIAISHIEGDSYTLTRRPFGATSLRGRVREELAKNYWPIIIPNADLNAVRAYVGQWDKEHNTYHRCEGWCGGVEIVRDKATEVCAPLIAVLNNADSSVDAIKAALEVVSQYCGAVCNSRKIWNE